MIRAVLSSVVALLCAGCCADLALHAASGRPRVGEPRSVANPLRASREADDSLRVCVVMRVERGTWPFLQEELGASSVRIPSPNGATAVVIPYEAWLGSSPPCEPLAEGASILDLELVDPAGVPAEALELQDQRLVVRASGEVVARLELRSAPRDSGNPLFLPLVPIGYATDAVLIPVLGVAYGAAKVVEYVFVAVIVLIGAPINHIDEAIRGDSGGSGTPPPSSP